MLIVKEYYFFHPKDLNNHLVFEIKTKDGRNLDLHIKVTLKEVQSKKLFCSVVFDGLFILIEKVRELQIPFNSLIIPDIDNCDFPVVYSRVHELPMNVLADKFKFTEYYKSYIQFPSGDVNTVKEPV